MIFYTLLDAGETELINHDGNTCVVPFAIAELGQI